MNSNIEKTACDSDENDSDSGDSDESDSELM